MLKRLLRFLPPLLTLVVLLASLWVLRQELQQYQQRDLGQLMAAVSPLQGISAIALTLLNCFVFTGYDALAARVVGQPLPYYRSALAATSIPIGNTVGLPLLSGSAIRYRLYAAWQVPPLKIAQIIAFCNLSFWLGLFTVGGLLFVAQPVEIPALLLLPFGSTRPIGVLFLGMIAAYLLWVALQRRPLNLGKIALPPLPLGLCLIQLALASLDWTLAAAVLYSLLPAVSIGSYGAYFGIYLLAQLAGVVSNVPGGLGVFEAVLLLLLPQAKQSLLSPLLIYRAIYYLLPLVLAAALLSLYELRSRRYF